jgi:enoyl-CoA hydratase/carnithine racemase
MTTMTAKAMREPGLQTLGLGGVLDIFQRGGLPVETGDLVDRVFGKSGDRGALVISGANGIVGAGKAMQLGSRLAPYDVRIVGLDFPDAPDGIGKQYPGLVRAFGRDEAAKVMGNIIRLSYDGAHLPSELSKLRPLFLLEAIPEVLEIKRAHYQLFRDAFPGIEIRSVTSGFPASELGVGIAHPAFPHEINKIWEVVEPEPSAITQLFWSLGLIPIPVSDNWSFVLDVLFCGLTHAATRYHRTSNMPFWKIDKWVRRILGPNPFRAHDAIGAKGANFLTWSCLSHLGKTYGDLFTPTAELTAQKDGGLDWYPPNHFRPLVDWKLNADEEEELKNLILGPLFQMTSLLLHEKRASLKHMNAIGELCAQFRRGLLAVARSHGADDVRKKVEAYQKVHPEAAGSAWHPAVFDEMDSPEWQQLYVNAEHDGTVGVISISRESYNSDVDAEMNRAIDWLKAEGVERVILSGDFHLSTQMVGADTSEFYPALEKLEEGLRVATAWSRTARRLADEFKISVGFIGGKRCLGGMMELMMHCHYLVALEGSDLGMPEVTLPVVPGMEGCHWPFRKSSSDDWPKLIRLLLTGRSVKAGEAVGWLVDYAGPLDSALKTAWKIASNGDHGIQERKVETKALKGLPAEVGEIPVAAGPATEAARQAIMENIRSSCGTALPEAIDVQAKHSALFMLTPHCQGGRIGADYKRTTFV